MVYANKFVMCVLVNGQIQKERADDTVVLPFGSEYTLRFRNKHDRRGVVKIFIDGEEVSGNGYVVPAKGHIDIQRHSHRDAAFKLVPLDSEEAIDAGKNGPNHDRQKGVIEARFYLEKKPETVTVVHHYHEKVIRDPYPVPVKPWRPYQPFWYENGWAKLSNASSSTFSSNTEENTSAGLSSFDCLASNSSETMDSYTPSKRAVSEDIATFKRINKRELHDGATVEGDRTGQSFRTVSIDIEDDYVSVKLVLQGFYPEARLPDYPRKVVPTVDLETENQKLREQIADAQKTKNLEEENKRLREELARLKQ